VTKLPRITEPAEGRVHYAADPLSGNVTLCGRTDFLGVTPGKPTRAAVSCRLCASIIRWVKDHTE
jgi:hypothetical protein